MTKKERKTQAQQTAEPASDALAIPLSDVARSLNLAESTMGKLRAAGKGPKCFLLGRKLYVRPADARAWIDAMAQSEAA